MRIVCISDTHGQHGMLKLPDGDMLIHAGDLTLRGTAEQINDSLAYFAKLPYKYKIIVAGNHDFGLEQKNPDIVIPPDIIYLENSEVIVEGLKIWGSPVSTPYYDWAFMWDEVRREALYKTIPHDTDIIINHGPAFGVLDWTRKSTNAGCEVLRRRISEIKPKLFVCGHIHEDYGVREIEATTFVNAAILNKQYQIANPAVIITI
jgi:Icc-related predicted phosphoesterase